MNRILLTGLFAVLPAAALAHSPLDATTPADGAAVSEVPAEIALDFKGDIRLTRVTMIHAGAHSVDLDLGEQTSFASDFVLPMESMGGGDYVIEWRGLGADGHAMRGSFSFTVE